MMAVYFTQAGDQGPEEMDMSKPKLGDPMKAAGIEGPRERARRAAE